jgi:hypothetical protein
MPTAFANSRARSRGLARSQTARNDATLRQPQPGMEIMNETSAPADNTRPLTPTQRAIVRRPRSRTAIYPVLLLPVLPPRSPCARIFTGC